MEAVLICFFGFIVVFGLAFYCFSCCPIVRAMPFRLFATRPTGADAAGSVPQQHSSTALVYVFVWFLRVW
jgi:hypothetical protein